MTTIAGPGVTIIKTPISNTVAPTTPMTMRRAALYVTCTARRIKFYLNEFDFGAACRSLATMMRLNTSILFALCVAATPACFAADSALTLRAGEAIASIQPRSESNLQTALPALELTLVASFACPADARVESVTFSVVDTYKRFNTEEILDADTLQAAITVPAGQLAPVAAEDFCISGNALSMHDVVVPGVTSAHVSLRCHSELGTSVRFASSTLPVRLLCLQDDNQASSVDR